MFASRSLWCWSLILRSHWSARPDDDLSFTPFDAGVLERLRRLFRWLRPSALRQRGVQLEGSGLESTGTSMPSTSATINTSSIDFGEAFILPWLSYEEDEFFMFGSAQVKAAVSLAEKGCSRLIRVAVRVHEDSGSECRAVDLHVKDYVDRPNLSNGGVIVLSEAYKKFYNPEPMVGEKIYYVVISSEGALARRRRSSLVQEGENPFGRGDPVGNYLIARFVMVNPSTLCSLPAELTGCICDTVPLQDLFNLAACCRVLAKVVDDELCQRLRTVVRRFIPKDKIQHFFRLMKDSKGGLGSYVALDFLLFVNTSRTTFNYRTLEFIVSSETEGFDMAIEFFKSCGYLGFMEGKVDNGNADDDNDRVLCRARGRRAAASRQLKLSQPRLSLSVVVTESRGSIFASVLHGIYSFYPALTLARQALADFDIDPDNIILGYRTNQHWGGLCDHYCPLSRRKMEKDRSQLVYRWKIIPGGKRSKGLRNTTFAPSLLDQQPILWASVLACTNPQFRESSTATAKLLFDPEPFLMPGVNLSAFSDDRLLAISESIVNDNDSACASGDTSEIRFGMLYGAVCERPLLVALRVHIGCERECHPIDLHVEDYVDRSDMKQTGGFVVEINDTYRKVDVDARSYMVIKGNSPGVLLVSGSNQVLGGGEERRESQRDEHSSGPERATPRETGDRRSGQTGKRRRQTRCLRVSESGAIDRNGSGTEGTRGSLRIRKRNGCMSGPKSVPKVSRMAEGFGSGPEARECSGTRDMGRKRAEASRSLVARRRRQGDGIEQRWDGWDGWGSDDVQPASVGLEMVRSSAVRGQGVLWHMTKASYAVNENLLLARFIDENDEQIFRGNILVVNTAFDEVHFFASSQKIFETEIMLLPDLLVTPLACSGPPDGGSDTNTNTNDEMEFYEEYSYNALHDANRWFMLTVVGGGHISQKVFTRDDIIGHTAEYSNGLKFSASIYDFVAYVKKPELGALVEANPVLFGMNLPVAHVVPKLLVEELKAIAKLHSIALDRKCNKKEMASHIAMHQTIGSV
ncbi:hypothetical protein BKA70DRAFT_1225247 [Coprinopsis sp. MPI-PUGE-AT-0042]|nr:hypothetical protein BKA70DRAFT_1225247 [Coprinopsis sp. MPI-PUGE-AT-0042]